MIRKTACRRIYAIDVTEEERLNEKIEQINEELTVKNGELNASACPTSGSSSKQGTRRHAGARARHHRAALRSCIGTWNRTTPILKSSSRWLACCAISPPSSTHMQCQPPRPSLIRFATRSLLSEWTSSSQASSPTTPPLPSATRASYARHQPTRSSTAMRAGYRRHYRRRQGPHASRVERRRCSFRGNPLRNRPSGNERNS